MSFRAPRSMMVQCRDKNSFPVDEKKKERKKELTERIERRNHAEPSFQTESRRIRGRAE